MNKCEIAVKSLVEYQPFKSYFHQGKNEYSVQNSYRVNEGMYLISGFVLFKFLVDNKIDFEAVAKYDEYVKFKINSQKLEKVLKFYLIEEEKEDMLALQLDSIVVIKEIFEFYEKFSNYFTQVDNYFNIEENLIKMSCSSFFILSHGVDYAPKLIQHKKYKGISIGEDVYTVNSNLSVISYEHFSNSYAKGIVGNKIKENIYLLDIRVLPNSHGSIVYNSSYNPVLIVLPILNVKYSYTPLVFAYDLEKLLKTFENGKTALKIDEKIEDFKTKNIFPSKLNDSVFLVYNNSSYATCIYLGSGKFLTNKHFFSNYAIDDEEVILKNYKNREIKCKKYFIPSNNMDLAILELSDKHHIKLNDSFLRPIRMNDLSKPKLLQSVYCIGFSYFSKEDYLNKLETPNVSKGIISKIIKYNNEPFVYQIDAACYSGGSGGPIIQEDGSLVGILFQNLSFHTESIFMQLPNSGFIIAENIISQIIHNINNLSSLWFFNLENKIIDKFLNFQAYNAKF